MTHIITDPGLESPTKNGIVWWFGRKKAMKYQVKGSYTQILRFIKEVLSKA